MQIETTIERLGHLGDGIASGPLFVPGALPGETVAGTPVGDRLEKVRILSPVADRVAPPCRHARACGGCALQHARDDFVARWKCDVVLAALAARDIPARIGPVHVSPARSRRRAVLHGARTRNGAIVGLKARASQTIVDIPECLVMTPKIAAALPALRDMTALGASRRGTLDLAVIDTRTGLDVAVSGAKSLDLDLSTQLARLAEGHDLARLTWNGEIVVTSRAPLVQMGPAQVCPPPGAFLQATAEGQAALVAAVTDGCAGATAVLDLFAGCGTFALPLTRQAAVHAVESDAAMLQAAQAGWRATPGLHPLTTEPRDLFRRPLAGPELDRYEAVVIDPPRAGAEAQLRELARGGLSRIVSVSCNPVSFARDAEILLKAGFAMGPVTIVDQFRWSPHVELVATFTRG